MYKYDKIVNGSYRDYVPNHYQSGYQMVTWTRLKYDPQLWNSVLSFTAKQPFTFNPVNISLTKSAGLTKKKLSGETFDSLKTIWTKDVSENNAMPYEPLNPEKKGKYINYYSPVFAGSDSIIAIKTSLTNPAEFVLISPSSRSEKKIHNPGQIYPWFISYAKGKIVWVEDQYDPRWENRNYSVIKLMDLKNNRISRLTQKSRYLSASVSPDGRKIAAIENTVNNVNNFVLIDAETGTLLQSVPAPGNACLQHPQWAEGGEKITVIFLTEEGEGVMSINTSDQIWETLIKAGRDDLQSTFLRNDSLFYISSSSGTENVYLRTPGGIITELTRSRYGAIDLCLSGEKVFFSDYTSLGNNICSTTLAEVSGKTNENFISSSFIINRFDIKQHSFDNKSNTIYKPEPYRKWQNLFRFHSWMPLYADIHKVQNDPASVRPGFSVMSQNSLSTLISSVGYEYSADRRHKFHSRLTWKGWYPVLESQMDFGDQTFIYHPNNIENPPEIRQGLRFTNSVSVPLNFSSGKFTRYLYPSFSTEYSNSYIYLNDKYDYGQIKMINRFYFSNYQKSAIRDIYPRWAQVFDLSYTFSPFDKMIYGTDKALKTAFYFPGFFPNNGTRIRLEKEKQVTVLGLFYGNRVSLPRGYKNIFPKEIDFFSVDYVLPLAYPDFNISSLIYIKRIRTGLFYDYASGPGSSFYQITSNGLDPLYNTTNKESFKSFGLEVLADFHILRIPYMISGGVQTAWKKINETPSFELLFNINLFGMTIGRSPI